MRIIQRMMKLFDCRAVLVIVGMAAMTANATLRTWVGASGGSWYVAENWDPTGIPGEKDTVVFRPESELTASSSLVLPDAVIAAANAWSSGCRFVKSGNSLILEVAGTDGFIPLRRVS